MNKIDFLKTVTNVNEARAFGKEVELKGREGLVESLGTDEGFNYLLVEMLLEATSNKRSNSYKYEGKVSDRLKDKFVERGFIVTDRGEEWTEISWAYTDEDLQQ